MTDKVEINSDEPKNISLEEEAKQQEAEAPKEVNETIEQPQEARPEWLPEKFANAEELAKAYGALETKLSQQTEEKPVAEETTTDEQPNNSLEPFYDEYSQSGELSEKSYADLAKMGLDKNLVDGYIAGQKAIADNDVATIHNTVGGEENYQQLLDWSAQNLTEAEKDAFNSTLDTGSIDQVKFAVQAIASRAGITGQPVNRMIEGDTSVNVPDTFESIAQVTEAMNDPRYSSDPAYRKQIELKLAKSSVI